VSGLLLKVADFEGVKPAVQADMEQLKKDITQNVESLSQCLGLAQNIEKVVSQLNSEFHSRCKVYDSLDVQIKDLDDKYQSSLGLVKQEFDEVLASAMMNFKDDFDNRVQALMVQIKQQEDSIADVVETMGQQNSAQDKVIKEMREAVAALRSN
jgi:hypothetical protein